MQARWLVGEAKDMAANQGDRRLKLVADLLQGLESQPAQQASGEQPALLSWSATRCKQTVMCMHVHS